MQLVEIHVGTAYLFDSTLTLESMICNRQPSNDDTLGFAAAHTSESDLVRSNCSQVAQAPKCCMQDLVLSMTLTTEARIITDKLPVSRQGMRTMPRQLGTFRDESVSGGAGRSYWLKWMSRSAGGRLAYIIMQCSSRLCRCSGLQNRWPRCMARARQIIQPQGFA